MRRGILALQPACRDRLSRANPSGPIEVEEHPMASDKLITITDANFDAEVLKSAQPVLIDFWAAWCAPCRAIAPVVEQLAAEYAGKLKVGKVNIDENPAVPTQYDVR